MLFIIPFRLILTLIFPYICVIDKFKLKGMNKSFLQLPFLLLILFFFSCDVNQTKETQLPDVDIKSGQLPSFDIDWASVDVGTRTTKVTVPKLVVVTEEIEVEVPYVEVDLPNDGEKEEITLLVEAEIKEDMHDIEIMEVYASENNLFVVSNLKKTGRKLSGDQTVRVSDRLILNAPDLNIKHYIIGDRPPADHNRQFKYFRNKSSLNKKLKNAKLIYKNQ